LIDRDSLFRVVVDEVRELVVILDTHPSRLRIEMNLDPVARERIREQLRRVALFATEKHRIVLN
jgi:hypothetical protein